MFKTKFSAVVLCAALAAVSFLGCGSANSSQPEPADTPAEIRVGILRGPTGMGMVGLMEQNEQGETENSYIFELAGAPEDMTARILSGEVDIAAVPTNLASVLYNRTEGDISIIAVNTLGVLYILDSTGEINSLEDLRGRTLEATGQGATNEFVLQYILEQNGIDDVEVIFRSEHSELAARMLAGEAEIAMLPQPFVTTVTNQNSEINIAINLTEEWANISDAPLVMGSLIVRSDFLENNKDAINIFLREYAESVEFVNNVNRYSSIYPSQPAQLMEKFDIIPAAVAARAIPYSNLVFIEGDRLRRYVLGYLEVLFEANPQSVGGGLPSEAFFYSR